MPPKLAPSQWILGHTIVDEQLATKLLHEETRSNFLFIVWGSDSVTNAILNSMCPSWSHRMLSGIAPGRLTTLCDTPPLTQ